jgi:hypothetical protein
MKTLLWIVGIFLLLSIIGAVSEQILQQPSQTARTQTPHERDIDLQTLDRPEVRKECGQNNWKIELCRAIDEKVVAIGMTGDEVRLAWGNPEKINVTTTSGTEFEQWVYGLDSYVYLENGKVTSKQISR